MKPKEILCQWVDAFNNADTETIVNLYDDNAINHQVANEPVIGKEAIKKMFEQEFSQAKMVCIVENIFEENADYKETIQSLNQLLQGEYMAVESFNNFISKLEVQNSKQTFQEVQKQHRENIDKLAGYIQEIGGRPEENLGMKGKMGDIKTNMELGSDPDTADIIDKAIDGETQGVNMAEKVLRGNLDERSRDIAGEILHKDRKSIEKLKSLQ